MKKYLLALFFLPLMSYGQQCSTLVPNNNFADSVIFCVDSVSCFGGSDGRIVISVYPQINNFYRYNWDTIPQLGLNILDSLVSGTPGVAITDTNNNFIIYIDIPIYEPSPINNFVVPENPTCFDSSNGSLSIVTNGGTSPFSYNWSNGSTATGLTTELNNLFGGQYTLITIDNNLCSDTTTYTLIEPNQVNSTTITDTLSCIGLCDGQAIVTPADGIAPYTYLWSNGDTDSTATGLCYGTNTVTITDVNGCIATNTVTIANPDTLKLSNITIDSACYQICDGELSVTIEGGISPYEIEWSLGGNIFDTINTTTEDTLCPGNYQIKFTDANLCVDSVIIPLIERDSFVVQDWIIDDSCYNSCTGQITVQLLNPVNLPIIYSWDNGGNDTVISNLCSDTFELVIIDNRLCLDTFNFFVEPGDSMYFDTVEVMHNNCYGDEDGVISLINFTGGVQPLDYLWSTSETTSGINSLPSGFYNVTITDANGCSLDSSNIEVSQPDSLFATPSSEDVSCFGGSDGLIDIDLFGGAVPYFISWDIVIPDSTLIDTVSAGIYIYSVIDSNNCTITDTIIIEEPEELIIADSLIDVLCKGESTGEIHITVTGGTPPYEYSLNGGAFQSQAYFDNLSAGLYSIIVKDANDCEITSNLLDVSEPLSNITTGLVDPNLLCFSDTGTVVLNVSGGTGTLTYSWNNGITTQNLNGIGTGTYFVTVTDANGCLVKDTSVVIEPDEIESNPSPIITDVDCFGNTTGSINVTIVGGETPYDYLWSNGDTTSSISNLSAGTYDLIVTDDNNCKYVESIIINEPDLLEVTYVPTHVACFGESNGEIDITVTGGTSPYNYAWSSLTIDEDLLNILAGTYTVTATDANNCSTSVSATINEPSEIIYSVSTIDLLCEGVDEGQISISSISGGTPAYEYSIDGSTYQLSSDAFNNLSAGNYTVDIRDQNGCTKNALVVLDEPIGFSTIVTVQNIDEAGSCNGDASGSISFTISGNTSPYSYSWSNGESTSSIYNLTAGTYSLDLYDANNCSMIYSYLITEPDAISLDYSVTPTSCEEKNDGSITTFVTGGTSPITYGWGTGEATSDIYNLAKGTYSLLIEDANGCSLPLEFIEVNFDGFNGCIEIPSGFTPNNDNAHDEWVIYGLSDFPNVLVKVYNRWGQELFSSSGYDIPWDGKHNGVDLPTATYYYVIELNESDKVFNGTVTIKR